MEAWFHLAARLLGVMLLYMLFPHNDMIVNVISNNSFPVVHVKMTAV